MNQEEPSVEESLKAIREMMSRSAGDDALSEDILELTEDDLCPDELKEDDVNENLTKISDISIEEARSSIEVEKKSIVNSDKILISAENAARSIEAIKDLIQKVKDPEAASYLNNITTMEGMSDKNIKPLLESWLNQNLPSMLEQVIQKEIKKLSLKKEDI